MSRDRIDVLVDIVDACGVTLATPLRDALAAPVAASGAPAAPFRALCALLALQLRGADTQCGGIHVTTDEASFERSLAALLMKLGVRKRAALVFSTSHPLPLNCAHLRRIAWAVDIATSRIVFARAANSSLDFPVSCDLSLLSSLSGRTLVVGAFLAPSRLRFCTPSV